MERVLIKINGIVQGVGFRPFIHKLTREYGLAGYIRNTSSGVELELDGERDRLEGFVKDIPLKAPPLAVIEGIEAEYCPEPGGFRDFEIRISRTEEKRNTLISPDISVCDDCLKELRTPSDRRYRYPFINCTNCGPRFTIIKDVPYDRANTSMGMFPMCVKCDAEYHNIENRRYHAQPDCCPDCGPRIFFTDGVNRNVISSGDSAIGTAREYLIAGRIVAVKGLGGMHLACRCDSPEAIHELRRRKQRDDRPFAVMCRSMQCARSICEISDDEERILTCSARPIVLLRKRKDAGCALEKESLDALSENGYLGVMLPYTPLHYLLLGDDIDMLVMTSANLSDTPIIYENSEAIEKLDGIADGFLLHDRDIQTRCDDSLCFVRDGREYFVRRSRGYVPFPVRYVPEKTERPVSVLACGAEQKASFALSKENYVFPSQHIGDLKNLETFMHYTGQIVHFEKLFDAVPEAVACDMHPDYMSAEYAARLSREKSIPAVRVQHHHAHMASCMADNSLTGEVIGLIWDGTGFGTDGTIWGGECLIGGYRSFRRFGSILPIPLIGGDRAVRELDRVAYAMLRLSGAGQNMENAEIYGKIMSSGINCPVSSGMGRLFDGVAAITGIIHSAGYEGQGAVLLEAAACGDGTYSVAFTDTPAGMTFDWRPMVREIAEDVGKGAGKEKIAAGFMNTLVEMAVHQCVSAGRETGLERVVLSGGTFQNMYIMDRLPARLVAEGFTVYSHRRVSCNDEGICLGQIAVAQSVIGKDASYVPCSSSEN